MAEVVNDPATETGAAAAAAAAVAVAAATVAVAGNREGRQQSPTSSSTLILHDIITV